jgi:hypothetical protein
MIELIPGEKYEIDGFNHNPYTYVEDLRKFGFLRRDECFIFITSLGDCLWLNKANLKRIKKHEPMISRKLTGWITYTNSPYYSASIIDKLLKKDCWNLIYNSKREALNELNDNENLIYGELTFKQLPEPEEE